jgi:hypothetical protein
MDGHVCDPISLNWEFETHARGMFYFIHSALRGVQSVYTYNLNDVERTRMEDTKFGPDMQAH